MLTSSYLNAPRNVTFFTVASAVVLGAGVLLFGLLAFSGTQTMSRLEGSAIFRAFCGVVGVVGAPAGIAVAVGMLWYWAKLDNSSKLHKTMWFLLFVVTGFFGLAIYSLVVYRRQATRTIEGGQ